MRGATWSRAQFFSHWENVGAGWEFGRLRRCGRRVWAELSVPDASQEVMSQVSGTRLVSDAAMGMEEGEERQAEDVPQEVTKAVLDRRAAARLIVPGCVHWNVKDPSWPKDQLKPNGDALDFDIVRRDAQSANQKHGRSSRSASGCTPLLWNKLCQRRRNLLLHLLKWSGSTKPSERL